MPRIMFFLSVAALVAVEVPQSFAVQLVFEPATGAFGDYGALPAGYGDRVASTTQDGFLYSLDGGTTPNVITQFGSTDGLVNIYTWGPDYGDLQHIIFAQEPVQFEFRLVADAGYKVTLNSFDMGGWSHADFASIGSVSVEDGSGNVLYSQADVHIDGDANGPQHTHFSFAGVSAGELRIKFDSTTDGHGNTLDSDDVGLDNINFSQTAAGPLLGDYNTNGTVDAADYPKWRKNNATNNALPNDNNLGTPIGASHYNLWRAHFGQSAGSGAAANTTAAIPEPATSMLLLLAAAACLRPPSSAARRGKWSALNNRPLLALK